MTRRTRSFLLVLLIQRAFDLEGRIKTLRRRGGKIPRDHKDVLIAQAHKELRIIARAKTELQIPAVPVAASPAGDEAAEAVARSVPPASAVAIEEAKALLGVDDYDLWRLGQQANIAMRDGDVWEE